MRRGCVRVCVWCGCRHAGRHELSAWNDDDADILRSLTDMMSHTLTAHRARAAPPAYNCNCYLLLCVIMCCCYYYVLIINA